MPAKHGTVLVVAYLPGLTMRRIADLYPRKAKTDARDAFVIADTWTDPVSTPLLLGGAPKMRLDIVTGKVYSVAGAMREYPARVRLPGA